VNDFESTLVSALQAEADKTTQTLDTRLAAQRLESRLDAIDRDRRHRTWVKVIAVAAAAAVAVAIVLVAGRQPHRSAPIPPVQPPPSPTIPGGEVLARNPFLPSWYLPTWHVVRQQAAAPSHLTNCIDPRDWNAVESRWATYADPTHPSTRVNEFVLQYADASSAHHALLDAWHQIKHCPKPDNASDVGSLDTSPKTPDAKYDEGFGRQRLWTATPRHPERPLYALRVARAGNVLIVVEDTGIPSDRTPYTLTTAVQAALPHYVKGG
jgi:hypothetical protein